MILKANVSEYSNDNFQEYYLCLQLANSTLVNKLFFLYDIIKTFSILVSFPNITPDILLLIFIKCAVEN